ncbi:hypothetical protein GOP47_0014544 [Adiantum capillus-veneris]|uniref:NF-X1-type domain-containing protein n=1 Tax=Adiantum capillus-veneris TaxID=13818 RepID=A0A9D4UMF8_ADICA|nr:hypothetical protein GOP47_0014544 [Adiantum capillus-veneris]
MGSALPKELANQHHQEPPPSQAEDVEQLGKSQPLLCKLNQLTVDKGPLRRHGWGANAEEIRVGPMLDVEMFQSIPIVPRTIDELLLKPQNLPAVKVGQTSYTSVTEYLATNFCLLHEDFWGTMREGIIRLRQTNHQKQNVEHQMQVYCNVKLEDVRFTETGATYKVTFTFNKNFCTLEQQLDCLKFGSLLCISDDSFKALLWATVINYDARRSAGRSAVELRCIGDPLDRTSLQYGKSYTMAESTSAFFEAYVHSLRNLQRVEMAALPFAEHLVSLVSAVKPPSYLASRNAGSFYSLECVFPNGSLTGLRQPINIMEEWPEFDSPLDSSQKDAIKHGLTKRLAVLQGPPGTGKTFVGLALTKILLSNLQSASAPKFNRRTRVALHVRLTPGPLADVSNMSRPILIVCYTNHALDQFLEGIYEFEQRLVRYGRRCKSSKLESCLMSNLRRKTHFHRPIRYQEEPDLKHRMRYLRLKLKETKRMLELQCISKREHLTLIAPDEQVDNLFLIGDGCSQGVIQMWLQGLPSPSDQEECGVPQQDLEKKDDKDSEEAIADEVRKLDLYEDDSLTVDKIFNEPYPWTLGKSSRHRLHRHWLELLKKLVTEKLVKLTMEYEKACNHNVLPYDEVDLAILQDAKVVGMTVSAAARRWELFVALKPNIMIVEEAAEVLEAHIVACLTPHTEHLILIGDHMQLRPSVSNHRLSVDHKLDVSMFERLVTGQVEHKSLNVQRRMRPCISRLLKRFYPELIDHESVTLFEGVRGLQKNVFFWDHSNNEDPASLTTKANKEEAAMVVALALYLTQFQGYKGSEVTILTLYAGQRETIKRMLGHVTIEHGNNESMRVTSVDDFQGEETNIIILSLVRSNESTVGFAKNPNRICVALSRARHGLYIMGNAALFLAKSSVWKGIIEDLGSVGNIGTSLPLSCPNHPDVSDRIATCAADIGGSPCRLPCKFLFSCGHLCPRPCHYIGDHQQMSICWKQCEEVHMVCNHVCDQACYKHDPDTGCPPCEKLVPLDLSFCGHQILVPCHQFQGGTEMFKCTKACPRRLLCGHSCQNGCGEPCTTNCEERVSVQLPCQHSQYVHCSRHSSLTPSPCMERCTKELACGHSALLYCNQSIESVSCVENISMQMPCGHVAEEKCSNRKNMRCNAKVHQTLPCGHIEVVVCSLAEHISSIQCCSMVDTNLLCGHKATIECHRLTSGLPQSCSYPCSHKLPCGHSCSGTCARCQGEQHVSICNHPCAIPLPCFHRCKSQCGAPCKSCGLKKPCLNRCVHERCAHTCEKPCVPCLMPCPWMCEHYSCSLPCSSICTRPRCDAPCGKALKCGHPCIGMCGEPCPTKCRICDPSTPELFTRQKIGKLPSYTLFVQLVDCGHICEVSKLDSYMDGPNLQKKCPSCLFPISERTLRYSSVLKALRAKAQERKRRCFSLRQE